MKKQSAPLMLLLTLLVSFNAYCLPNLNSLPTASATIYLDFDGQTVNSPYWNSGSTLNCLPSGLSDVQITEVFNRVSEDYRPFNINITTDLTKYIAAPLSQRMRVIITPTSNWFQGVGGVAFTGSFKWGDDTPAFVFCDRLGPNSAKMIAECCSHESGHTVGLSHQSKYDGTCNLTATYNDGIGIGINAWAPIMGNSYYRNMTGWNNGPTPYGCSNKQDNLSIITSQNGFSFRADDYSDSIHLNPTTLLLTGANVDGIITTTTDQDAFTFTLAANAILHLDAKPYSVDANYQGANLDVKLLLYNSNKVLLNTYDPATTMNVVIDTVLNSGTYYLVVDGAGNNNVDDYGSLGSYSIKASIGGVLPIRNITLSGKTANNKHDLNWAIIADEPVQSIVIESSSDGIHFNSIFNNISASAKSFVYAPYQHADLYYRIKATSVLNQSMYSNTIMLKGTTKTGKPFKVSTFVRAEITVNADIAFQYQLSDINGNMLARGMGQAGYNSVDVSRYQSGMYVLQIINNNQKQIERIVKQ